MTLLRHNQTVIGRYKNETTGEICDVIRVSRVFDLHTINSDDKIINKITYRTGDGAIIVPLVKGDESKFRTVDSKPQILVRID